MATAIGGIRPGGSAQGDARGPSDDRERPEEAGRVEQAGRLAADAETAQQGNPVPFHTREPSTVGMYHVTEDCRHARRIRPRNRCAGGERGCYWCNHGIELEPCPACGP